MKKCPYCAENVKDDAKICKHCKGDLSKTLIKQSAPQRSKKKMALVILAVMTWFISIPIIIVWSIWKKGKFSKNRKIVFTMLTLVCYAGLMSIYFYSTRQPVITITEPQNNFAIQADSIAIKGLVSPGNSKLMINGQPINSIISNGEFSYQVKLNDVSNTFNLLATNNTKKSSTVININRIFTEAELRERDARQAEVEAQRQAEAARSKAEQAAYESTPAGQLCQKHPNWTKENCQAVTERKYWIGMTYEMLVASLGSKPNSANPSNYGNGTSWQYCWWNTTPSCFYDNNDDGIIDSYN